MIQIHHHHTPAAPIRSCRDSKRGCRDAVAIAPGAVTKVKHAAQAAGRVVRAVVTGKPVHVSAEERDQRLSICRICTFWREGGNHGLGECSHRKCDCTGFKHSLATEACPAGKWD